MFNRTNTAGEDDFLIKLHINKGKSFLIDCTNGRKHFFNLTQVQLNNLASMMPMVLDLVRSPGKATIFINNMSEDDVSLVRSLTDFQFSELREIQGLIESAMRADSRNKLNLYLECIERAPWHCHAIKSAGVCHYISGDKKRAYDYLTQAAKLAPENEDVMANYNHVKKEI